MHAKWDVDSRLKHGERLAEILSMTLRNLWEKLNVELVPETRSQRTGRMIRGWGGALVAGTALIFAIQSEPGADAWLAAQSAAFLVCARALTVGLWPLHWGRAAVQLLVVAIAAVLTNLLDLEWTFFWLAALGAALPAGADLLELHLRADARA